MQDLDPGETARPSKRPAGDKRCESAYRTAYRASGSVLKKETDAARSDREGATVPRPHPRRPDPLHPHPRGRIDGERKTGRRRRREEDKRTIRKATKKKDDEEDKKKTRRKKDRKKPMKKEGDRADKRKARGR